MGSAVRGRCRFNDRRISSMPFSAPTAGPGRKEREIVEETGDAQAGMAAPE